MDVRLKLLSHLLRERGDAVLTGQAKLSLQLDELLYLTKFLNFSCSQDFVSTTALPSHISTVVDFLQKSKALKLTGANCCELFSLKICKSLRYLELYSVPVEILSDVDYLKCQTRTLSLNRSCSDLCVFLSSEDPLVWSLLTRANFCFNNVSTFSIPFNKLIPFIKYLDLSHNDIRDLGDTLKGLKFLETLKISFNNFSSFY